MQKIDTCIGEDSIFKILNRNGLISFTDFIFLLTLLSSKKFYWGFFCANYGKQATIWNIPKAPKRHFEIAFYMFDEDGNGNIDLAEFEKLQMIIRNQTTSGKRHRDTRMTGSVIRENQLLNEYFFGENLDQLLTVERFLEFQRKLQVEVIRMEFELCNLYKRESDGERVMSETTFGEMILAYAGLSPSKTKKMLKNVTNIYNSEKSNVCFTIFFNFRHLKFILNNNI